jgi:hypothetical protein
MGPTSRTVSRWLAWSVVVVLGLIEVRYYLKYHLIGTDFLLTIYHPAQAVLHGRTPYGNPLVITPLRGSVYPPSAFVGVAWLGFLPQGVAIALWEVVEFLAATATLWVLGVRDLRCYALWLLTPMVLATALFGNATILIILLFAILWRWRDNAIVAAAALTAAIAIKLFVAPMIIWLLFRGRFRAAAYTALATPFFILGAWAAIGFSAIGRYVSILSANDHLWGRDGPFLQSLVMQVGGSSLLAGVLGALAATALIAAAYFVGDLSAFTLTVAASILLAPVAWIGYLGLLVIPVAVLRPRFSPLWLVYLVGTYAHWWKSPLGFASAELSSCTLVLFAAVVAVVLTTSRENVPSGSQAPSGGKENLSVRVSPLSAV